MKKGGDTDRYINRELSWLSFNHRVLQEAQSSDNPLVERMRSTNGLSIQSKY